LQRTEHSDERTCVFSVTLRAIELNLVEVQ